MTLYSNGYISVGTVDVWRFEVATNADWITGAGDIPMELAMVMLAAVGVLEGAYLACFVLGLGYAVLAGIFSAVSGHGGGGAPDVDIGADTSAGGQINLGGGHDIVAGHDISSGEVDGHAIGSVEQGTDFSPFSPPVLAITLMSFGGTGIIFTSVLTWELWSLIPASASAVVMGGATFLLFWAIVRKVQASSCPKMAELIGIEAECTTPIPQDGVGEIAYVARGARFNARARSESGKPISSHAIVTITKWVGTTAIVKAE